MQWDEWKWTVGSSSAFDESVDGGGIAGAIEMGRIQSPSRFSEKTVRKNRKHKL